MWAADGDSYPSRKPASRPSVQLSVCFVSDQCELRPSPPEWHILASASIVVHNAQFRKLPIGVALEHLRGMGASAYLVSKRGSENSTSLGLSAQIQHATIALC